MFSDEFKDLLISMLKLDPESRPSADSIFEHPWFIEDDIATPEEVQIELEKRYKSNKEQEELELLNKI